MNKLFKLLTATTLAFALCATIAACGGGTQEQFTKEQWDKAVADTLTAENFTLNVTQTMGEESYETQLKLDKNGGKIWSKGEPGVSWSERFIVKTDDGAIDYTKTEEGWSSESSKNGEEGSVFDAAFAEWEGIGDGVKQMTVDLIPTADYKDVTFDDGAYTFSLTYEGTPMNFCLTFDGGYISQITVNIEVPTDGEETATVTQVYKFSAFGSTVITLPADLTEQN